MFRDIRHTTARAPVTVTFVAGADRSHHAPAFKGDNGDVHAAGKDQVLLGIGPAMDVTPNSIRLAAARLLRHLDRRADASNASVSVRLDTSALSAKPANASSAAHAAAIGRAFGEALQIANWRFDDFTGTATRRTPAKHTLSITATDRRFDAALAEGLALGECVNYSRTLGATPPNVCNPMWMAAQARKLARETGLRCTVIDHAKAKKLGMHGLTTVGHGSASKSCLIHLTYKPRRVSSRARGKKLVLVGKTLTYDTGGYSLKVNNGMKGMKYDKLGGTAVLGAMRAIAQAKLPIEVHAVLAAAENMVSDDSMRPDDIITISNGVTVEITNTDAEGRLVLADALVYAEKTIGATQIVDLATLTGGVVVALGSFCAGYFCNNDQLRDRLEEAATQSGEKLWRLPLWPEHRDYMRAQHADILNSNPGRGAHPIQGAAFLSFFVSPETPWAHVDIAGVGNTDSSTDQAAAGPTGYGVRLLADLASDMAG